MANKKPDAAATEADQSDEETGNSHRAPERSPAEPIAAIPDPIFATDEQGNDRPMSGGSFVRQADGTLIRNPEA